MPYQLEFWIREEAHPPVPSLWEELEAEQRAAMITMLARMISKAAVPPLTQNREENEHER